MAQKSFFSKAQDIISNKNPAALQLRGFLFYVAGLAEHIACGYAALAELVDEGGFETL